MRAIDLSPDRRNRLAPVPGRENVKGLVPPPCPRTLDAAPVLTALIAAEKAISGTAAIARLLRQPDLITRSLERREAVLSSQIEGTRTDLTQLLEYEATGSDEGLPDGGGRGVPGVGGTARGGGDQRGAAAAGGVAARRDAGAGDGAHGLGAGALRGGRDGAGA